MCTETRIHKLPYIPVSIDVIQDSSLSPECRWLITYLLSMEGEKNPTIKEIQEHVQSFIGPDQLRSILDEAINSGHLKEVKE